MMGYSKKAIQQAGGGTVHYTTGATLGGDDILTGSLYPNGFGGVWTADLSALAGGGGGTVSPSTQYEIPYYRSTSVLSGSSAMVLDASNNELQLTTSTVGGAALRLQNTAATSTANGLHIYNNSTQQVLQVGHNNNTDENYIWGTFDVPLKFATSGTERMRIAADGKVGIGTDLPSEKLQLQGDSTYFSILAADDSEGVRLGTAGSGKGLFYLRDAGGNNKIYLEGGGHSYINGGTLSVGTATALASAQTTILDASNPQLTLAYDGSNYFSLTEDGNYLRFKANAGNTATMALRDNGNTYFNGQNVIFETSQQNYFQIKGTNTLGFGDGADFEWSASGSKLYLMSGTTVPSTTPILGIQQNGNVGIGTASPSRQLSIVANATASTLGLYTYGNISAGDIGGTIDFNFQGGGAAEKVVNSIRSRIVGTNEDAAKLIFYTTEDSDTTEAGATGTERMTIDPTGNIGIGTDSPGRKLHLSTAGTTFMKFTSDSASDFSIGANSTAGFTVYDETNSLYRMSLDTAGNLSLGDNLYSNKAKLMVSGAIGFLSGSVTSAPGYTSLWASGSGLYWGDQEVYTNAPGTGEITGGGAADYLSYFTAGANITGTAGLQYDGTDLTISSSTAAKPQLTIRNNEDGVYGGEIRFIKDSTTPANDFLGSFKFYGRDTDDGLLEYAKYDVRSPDASAASPNAQHNWYGLDGSGNLVQSMSLINSQLQIKNSSGALSGIMYPYKTDGFGMKSIGSKMQINPGNSAAPHTGELHISAAYVGINTTSPSAFLHSEGATEQLRLGFDSSNYTSFTVAADGDLGITNNNVGIGTTGPSTKLEVVSSDGFAGYFQGTSAATITSDITNNHYLRIKNASTVSGSTALLGFQLGSGYQGAVIGTEQFYADDGNNSSANLVFATKASGAAAVRQMTLYNNANIQGAGTLEIIGSNGTVAITPDGDAEELVIRNAQRAGISIIHGEGSGDHSNIVFGSASDANGANIMWNYNAKTYTIGTQQAGSDMIFRTANGVEAMRIDDSQNVGIGTAAPASLLHLSGSASSEPVLMIQNTNDDANAGELQFYKDTDDEADNDVAGNISFYFNNDGSVGEVEKVRAALIYATSDDVTEDSEDGAIFGKHVYNGTEYQNFQFGGHHNAGNTAAWFGQEGQQGAIGFANNTADNNYLFFGRGLTTGSYQVSKIAIGNNAAAGNQQVNMYAQDDLGFWAGQKGSTANCTIAFGTNNVAGSDSKIAMKIDKDGNVGIGTSSPTEKLHVVGNSLLNGTVHASGASFQKSLGEVLYLRNALNTFDINAILQHSPNIQYVKPEPTSVPGVSVIPTELPLAEAENVGLEITVVQDWSADPTAALSVQKQTHSSDVIYEGGSNIASATVSISAYRGANKTFMIAAAGIWIVVE